MKKVVRDIFDIYASRHELRFLMNVSGFLMSPMRSRVGEWRVPAVRSGNKKDVQMTMRVDQKRAAASDDVKKRAAAG